MKNCLRKKLRNSTRKMLFGETPTLTRLLKIKRKIMKVTKTNLTKKLSLIIKNVGYSFSKLMKNCVKTKDVINYKTFHKELLNKPT